jgi:hypothetical protein
MHCGCLSTGQLLTRRCSVSACSSAFITTVQDHQLTAMFNPPRCTAGLQRLQPGKLQESREERCRLSRRHARTPWAVPRVQVRDCARCLHASSTAPAGRTVDLAAPRSQRQHQRHLFVVQAAGASHATSLTALEAASRQGSAIVPTPLRHSAAQAICREQQRAEACDASCTSHIVMHAAQSIGTCMQLAWQVAPMQQSVRM